MKSFLPNTCKEFEELINNRAVLINSQQFKVVDAYKYLKDKIICGYYTTNDQVEFICID